MIYGLDMRITDPAVIRQLISLSLTHLTLQFFAYSDFRRNDVPAFNPKLYVLEHPDNFTAGDLVTKTEMNVLFELAKDHPLIKQM